jgi:hypothetical protein
VVRDPLLQTSKNKEQQKVGGNQSYITFGGRKLVCLSLADYSARVLSMADSGESLSGAHKGLHIVGPGPSLA